MRTSAGAQGCGVDQAKLVEATQIFGTSFAGHDDEDNRITVAEVRPVRTSTAMRRVLEDLLEDFRHDFWPIRVCISCLNIRLVQAVGATG